MTSTQKRDCPYNQEDELKSGASSDNYFFYTRKGGEEFPSEADYKQFFNLVFKAIVQT